MRIHVLVNGPPEKTKGVRVRALFQELEAEHDVGYFYRNDDRRWNSALAFYKAIRKGAPDVIFVEGVAYSGVLAALVGKLLHGSRIVLSTGDAAYALAKSLMNPIRAQLVRFVEFTALHMADAIIAKGPLHKQLLEDRGFKNVFWIPDGVDTTLFRPLQPASLRETLQLQGRLTIGVVGSINLNKRQMFCYGWEVVEVLRRVKEMPVVGVIVGVGDGIPYLKAKGREYGVEGQLIFTGWVDHQVLPEYVNLIDICVSTQSNDLAGLARVTAKVPEYLACGRFIIASDVGSARTFIADCGVLLPYHGVKDLTYVEALAKEVRMICNNRSVLQTGLRGVETAKRYFDYAVLRPALRKVIEFVEGPGASAVGPSNATRSSQTPGH